MKLIVILGSLILLIDQIVKIIVSNIFIANSGITVIRNFFNLVYVKNYGAAFSFFSGGRIFLIAISIFSVFLIYKYYLKNKKLNKLESMVFGILLGGLFGNLIDRIFLGYVIDYLSFKIFDYYFPVFNFADICIVVATTFLIMIVGSGKDENKSNRRKKTRPLFK